MRTAKMGTAAVGAIAARTAVVPSMSGSRGRPSQGDPRGQQTPRGENGGMTALSYLLSGMALYGLVGWLIGRWTGVSVLFPIGMLAGLACGVALVIFRFGRS